MTPLVIAFRGRRSSDGGTVMITLSFTPWRSHVRSVDHRASHSSWVTSRAGTSG